MPTTSSESSSFVAGIDGLRALAVVAVLAFHLRLAAAPGGFLGVSLFFTLSGYLITQLLLRERRTNGRIDVKAFWVRRLRRLMPGAVLVIMAVAVAAIAFDRFPSVRLRGDLFAALGYVANWRFMSGSTSYADLFTSAPSPVLHFWSLAIEEQFYLVFPLVMAGLLARRRRWATPTALAAMLLASIAAGLVATSHNIVYYGAHTRGAEILAGSLLALWFPLGGFGGASTSRAARLVRSQVGNSIVFGGALGAFVALVAMVKTTDEWLYSGGLPAVSALSVVLIVGVQSPGLLRWFTTRSVVVRIGGLSYGLYLFHWPIFLLVTQDTTPLSGWSLHVVRLTLTGVVAWLSAHLVEQPIRSRRILRTGRSSFIALAIAIACAVSAVAFVPRTTAEVLAGLDAPDGFVTFGEENTLPGLKVLVVGSETSTPALVRTALGDEYELDLIDAVDVRCPLSTTPQCGDVTVRLDELARTHRPDIVVLAFGPLDREAVRSTLTDAPTSDPTGAPTSDSTVTQADDSAGDAAASEAEFFDATKAYVGVIARALATTPKILIDPGPNDAMTAFMEDAALQSTAVSALIAPAASDLSREVRTIRSVATGEDDRKRVMVIGDSTSYGISVAIDGLEGDRINVLWAGGQNCPLVDISAVKWWDGVEFDLERCPSLDVEWRRALDAFSPALIVVAVSVPEQAEQRYPDDPTWYLPGSERYLQVHDEFVSRFMAEVDSRGIDVLVLDSPPIHGGALGGAPFSAPERVAIWNSVITRWAELWPEITVVAWAAALAAFEPTPGALRGDGVHLRQDDLDVLVGRALLPLVVQKLFGVEPVSAVETETEPVEGP